MNKIKWLFMSRYKKLLYQIKTAQENHQRLVLKDGTILDFTVSGEWKEVNRNSFGHDYSIRGEYQKYYLVTRKFPTGNRKVELIRNDDWKMSPLYLPEFTTAVMRLEIEPFED